MHSLSLYTVFHLNLFYSSIEKEQRAEVIDKCYWPLLRLVREYELPIGIEACGLTLETVAAIDRDWIDELRSLITDGPCEFIGSGYAQIIGPLVPAQVNEANLRIGQQTYDFVPPAWLEWMRIVVLAFSFLALSTFGLGMLRPSQQLFGRNLWFLLTMLSVYLMGVLEIGTWLEWSVPDWLKATDAWTRYPIPDYFEHDDF